MFATHSVMALYYREHHFAEKCNVFRENGQLQPMIDESNGRASLIFLLSNPPLRFPLLSNTIAGSCLCPASSTRKLLSRRATGALPILVSRTLFTFSPDSRSLPAFLCPLPSETSIKRCRWFIIIRVRRPGEASTDFTEFRLL